MDSKKLSNQRQQPEENVLKSATAQGFATFLSRISGLVREQVFATLFGAGNFTDAFNIAFRIPNLLRDLFAEGSLSSAFIPTFTKVRAQRGDEDAWRVAGLVFRLLFAIGILIAVFGIYFSPELVNLFAPQFKNIPGKFELTVFMTRILFPFFPLVALAAAYMGILNACGKFFFPAFASALFNITSIITGIFFSWLLPRYGFEAITGMAVGVVLGGAVQAFSQLPVLIKAGYRFEKKKENQPPFWNEKALKDILLLMGPSIIGLAATQLNVLINSILATSCGPGAVSYLNYAFRLMQFPIGIFGVSLASATLPRISKLYYEKSDSTLKIKETLTDSLNTVMAINFPATAGMIAIGVPVISLLFQHGKFSEIDSIQTARVLSGYAVGLTAYSLVKVLVPICYVARRTKAAVISSLISVAMSYFVGSALSHRFGPQGLAISTSLSAIFNCIYLMWVLKMWIDFKSFMIVFFRQIFIAGCMGGGVFFIVNAIEPLFLHFSIWKTIVRFILVIVGVIFGIVFVAIGGKISGARETNRMFDLFFTKIKKKWFP